MRRTGRGGSAEQPATWKTAISVAAVTCFPILPAPRDPGESKAGAARSRSADGPAGAAHTPSPFTSPGSLQRVQHPLTDVSPSVNSWISSAQRQGTPVTFDSVLRAEMSLIKWLFLNRTSGSPSCAAFHDFCFLFKVFCLCVLGRASDISEKQNIKIAFLLVCK